MARVGKFAALAVLLVAPLACTPNAGKTGGGIPAVTTTGPKVAEHVVKSLIGGDAGPLFDNLESSERSAMGLTRDKTQALCSALVFPTLRKWQPEGKVQLDVDPTTKMATAVQYLRLPDKTPGLFGVSGEATDTGSAMSMVYVLEQVWDLRSAEKLHRSLTGLDRRRARAAGIDNDYATLTSLGIRALSMPDTGKLLSLEQFRSEMQHKLRDTERRAAGQP